MTHRQALEVLARHRGRRIVITTMTSVGIWPEFSDTPFDFGYIPSAMGHATSLGTGLALAQPDRGVIVVNGDGGMLMNLGSLVTIAAHAANVFVLLMDNRMYEVTGGQPTVGAGRIDFAGLAKSSGIASVYHFATLADWQAGAPEVFSGDGPAFIWLCIEGRYGQKTPQPPHPMQEQVRRLQGVLGLATEAVDQASIPKNGKNLKA